MNIIWNFLFVFFVLTINHSYARHTNRWAITNDQALIDESLKTVFSHNKFGFENNALESKVTRVVCKTQIYNGIHIKLYFELDQRFWKCMLYKSLVQTLSMDYDQCEQVVDENSSEEIQGTKNDETIKNEIQMNNQAKPEEFDDEAEIDAMRQGIQTETNNDQNQIDDNNQEMEDEENTSPQSFEHINENDDEADIRTDDLKEHLENDDQDSHENSPDDSINMKNENEQNQLEDKSNSEAAPEAYETNDKSQNK